MSGDQVWGHLCEVLLPCADAVLGQRVGVGVWQVGPDQLEWQLTQCRAAVTGTVTLTLQMRTLRPGEGRYLPWVTLYTWGCGDWAQAAWVELPTMPWLPPFLGWHCLTTALRAPCPCCFTVSPTLRPSP